MPPSGNREFCRMADILGIRVCQPHFKTGHRLAERSRTGSRYRVQIRVISRTGLDPMGEDGEGSGAWSHPGGRGRRL